MSLWQPYTPTDEPETPQELPTVAELAEALRALPLVEITPEEQKRIDAFCTPVTWETMMIVLD